MQHRLSDSQIAFLEHSDKFPDKLASNLHSSQTSNEYMELPILTSSEVSEKKLSGLSNGYLRKTRICFHHTVGCCSRGDRCAFAHSFSELRQQPNLHKTQLCINYQKRLACMKGSECRFAHGYGELRKLDSDNDIKGKFLKSCRQQSHLKKTRQLASSISNEYRYSSFSAEELAKSILKEARKSQFHNIDNYLLDSPNSDGSLLRLNSAIENISFNNAKANYLTNSHTSLYTRLTDSITAYDSMTIQKDDKANQRQICSSNLECLDEDQLLNEKNLSQTISETNHLPELVSKLKEEEISEGDAKPLLNWSEYLNLNLDDEEYDSLERDDPNEFKQDSFQLDHARSCEPVPFLIDEMRFLTLSKRSIQDSFVKAQDMMYSDDTPCSEIFMNPDKRDDSRGEISSPTDQQRLDEQLLFDYSKDRYDTPFGNDLIQPYGYANSASDAKKCDSNPYRYLLIKGQAISVRKDLLSPTTSCSTSKTFTVDRRSFSSDTRDEQDI